MHHVRRVISITFGLAAASASWLLACSSDSPAGTTTGPDGATPTSDSGGGVDSTAPPNDAGSEASSQDSGLDTGVDASPTLTTASGTSGEILVANDAVIGTFYEDDTILHWSNAPTCVVFVRGQTKPGSAAGRLTVGGAIVGSDGGTDQVINIDADPGMGNQYFFPATVFPPVDAFTVNVELSASNGFSAMPVQTLRPSPANPVTVSAPAPPDAGAPILIPSSAPLTITWTAPAGGFTAEQKIAFRLQVLTATAGAKLPRLYCAFPLSAGTSSIPANVLADMKTRAGGAADAQLHVFAGGAKEVVAATGSYFVEVARPADSTTLAFDVPARLQ